MCSADSLNIEDQDIDIVLVVRTDHIMYLGIYGTTFKGYLITPTKTMP